MSKRKVGPGVIPDDPNSGAQPIRMKGFYRALKRREPWAVKIDSYKSKSFFMYCWALYYRNIGHIIYKDNPFLKLLEK